MKRIFAAAAVVAMICAAAFAKAEKEPADEYDDGSSQVQAEKQEQKSGKDKKVTKIKWNTKANREAAMEGDPYNKKKLIGNRDFGERLLNTNKFTKVEPFTAYLKLTVGGMVSRKAHLIYREGTDIAGFEMYYDSSAYALQFAKVARGVLVDAVKRYYQDFDEKRLERSAPFKKTRDVYGFCEAYEDYGMVSGMMTYFSRPRVFFGYTFVKGSPYFTVNVRPAKNLAYGDSKSEEALMKANTIEQTYYFTKAQAKKLMTFLDDANISALQASSTFDEYSEGPADTDAYVEADKAENERADPDQEKAAE